MLLFKLSSFDVFGLCRPSFETSTNCLLNWCLLIWPSTVAEIGINVVVNLVFSRKLTHTTRKKVAAWSEQRLNLWPSICFLYLKYLLSENDLLQHTSTLLANLSSTFVNNGWLSCVVTFNTLSNLIIRYSAVSSCIMSNFTDFDFIY